MRLRCALQAKDFRGGPGISLGAPRVVAVDALVINSDCGADETDAVKCHRPVGTMMLTLRCCDRSKVRGGQAHAGPFEISVVRGEG